MQKSIPLPRQKLFASSPRLLLLIAVIGILLIGHSPLPPLVGSGDFRPYWTSAYLVAHGRDFSDPATIYEVEHQLAGWEASFPMFAWFAPTGNVALLPYAIFDFSRATYYWFLTNIVVICCSMRLLWRQKNTIWIPLVAAFGFSMTLLSLEGGQVNTLVLLGLALYLVLSQNPRRSFLAGASLVLTTIKAHLVILTLPLLLLDLVWRKQWRALAGFAAALIGCLLIMQFFYADWWMSSWRLISNGMGFYRLSPTLPGLLTLAGQGRLAKWLWLPALVGAVGLWWRGRGHEGPRTLVDLSLLGGMIVCPVGWSCDQIVLLIPILHLLEWAKGGSRPRTEGRLMVLLLVAGNFVTYYQRVIVNGSELWYWWVPPFLLLLYGMIKKSETSARKALGGDLLVGA